MTVFSGYAHTIAKKITRTAKELSLIIGASGRLLLAAEFIKF
jgi:hypothetical protein